MPKPVRQTLNTSPRQLLSWSLGIGHFFVRQVGAGIRPAQIPLSPPGNREAKGACAGMTMYGKNAGNSPILIAKGPGNAEAQAPNLVHPPTAGIAFAGGHSPSIPAPGARNSTLPSCPTPSSGWRGDANGGCAGMTIYAKTAEKPRFPNSQGPINPNYSRKPYGARGNAGLSRTAVQRSRIEPAAGFAILSGFLFAVG